MIQAEETVYSIDFKIKSGTTKPRFFKFTVEEMVTDLYIGSMFYKTKNEAIDTAIKHLTSLKDE